MAFFNRLSITDDVTKKRILPVFYSDNYFSVLPGKEKKIKVSLTPRQREAPVVCIEGWNVAKQYVEIKN